MPWQSSFKLYNVNHNTDGQNLHQLIGGLFPNLWSFIHLSWCALDLCYPYPPGTGFALTYGPKKVRVKTACVFFDTGTPVLYSAQLTWNLKQEVPLSPREKHHIESHSQTHSSTTPGFLASIWGWNLMLQALKLRPANANLASQASHKYTAKHFSKQLLCGALNCHLSHRRGHQLFRNWGTPSGTSTIGGIPGLTCVTNKKTWLPRCSPLRHRPTGKLTLSGFNKWCVTSTKGHFEES